MSPEEWELYESRQKAIINYNSSMIASREEGEKRGRAIGEKIGKNIGIREI